MSNRVNQDIRSAVESRERSGDDQKPKTSESLNGESVPRVCTLDGFAQELSERGGLDPTELEPLTQLTVTTTRTRYRLTLIEPRSSRVLVQNDEFFPIPFEALLCGASFGGSFLKQRWIGIGMRMELHCEQGNLVTAPVVSVETEEDAELAGPF